MDLDEIQKNIVEAEDTNIAVMASPGSGKTTIIINRVGKMITDKEIQPSKIVVLTFTKAAAENMKKRFKNQYREIKPPFFGTFHSFFYRILKEEIGRIKIIQEEKAIEIIRNVLKKRVGELSRKRIKEVLSQISGKKIGCFSTNNSITDINANIINECYKEYSRYLKDNNLMDFDDLQLVLQQLFSNNKNILMKYQQLYNYYLVDEYQDCDELQMDILKKLCRGNSIFAVGDEDQCIYGFRGSKPEYLVDFQKHFPNGVIKYLTNNYRSSSHIVNCASYLIENNKIRNFKEFKGVRDHIGVFQVKETLCENDQGRFIAQHILKEKKPFEDYAVLYRTNIESSAIVDSFIKAGIPFKLKDKEFSIYFHHVYEDIIAFMKLSIDTTDKVSFIRIINKPNRYIGKSIIEKIMKYCEKEDCFIMGASIYNLSFYHFKALKSIQNKIKKLRNIKPSNAIEYILDDLNYRKYVQHCCIQDVNKEDEIFEIINHIKASLKEFITVKDFVCHVDNIKSFIKENPKEDSVLLSTVHGVKGMEFENVFIINAVEGQIPFERSWAKVDIEEERRIFYVAITRAKSSVTIFVPKKVAGVTGKKSRFIEECIKNPKDVIN